MAGDEVALIEVIIVVVAAVVVIGVRQVFIKKQLESSIKTEIAELETDQEKSISEIQNDIQKIEERLIRAKESQSREFSEMNKNCQIKYEQVAKQEERIETLKERVNLQDTKLSSHQQKTHFELEKMDARVRMMEDMITQRIIPMCETTSQSIVAIGKDIVVIKNELKHTGKD